MAGRVLSAEFMHETNTFSVQFTDADDFRRAGHAVGDDVPKIYKGTRSAMGAAFEAAGKLDWTLVHPVVAGANPSGRVTDAAFDTFAAAIVEAGEGVDGVLLHLHGAMCTQSSDDGEGELLARLRARIGRDVPVAVVLDLHANVTPAMVENADILIAYRTYPHIDEYERMWQAARLLDRAMAGAITPVMALAQPPVLYALDGGRTTSAPMMELLRRGDALEQNGRALAVSIQAGFSSADIAEIGPSVVVTVDGDRAAARTIADELAGYILEQKTWSTIHMTPLAEAIARAKADDGRSKPIVISDYSDNPGGGAYGDATTLLRALIEADVRDVGFYAICDPAAVLEAQAAGVGNPVTLDLGCKVDPTVGGGPLRVTAHVAAVTDGTFIAWGPMGGGVPRSYGLSCLLRIGGIEIVVISRNGQATDLGQFTSLGVDPTRKSTLVVKSMQHFRAAFEPIASEVIEVDTGALCTRDFPNRPYRNVRRPIWPLDRD